MCPAGKFLLGICDAECGSIEPVFDGAGRACKSDHQALLPSEHLQHSMGSGHPAIQAPGEQIGHTFVKESTCCQVHAASPNTELASVHGKPIVSLYVLKLAACAGAHDQCGKRGDCQAVQR